MANFFLNLITFGAAERVEDAQFEYEEACDRYNRKVKNCKSWEQKYNQSLQTFKNLYQKSQREAMKLCLFVPADIAERKMLYKQLNINPSRVTAIEHTLDTAEIFKNYTEIISRAYAATKTASVGVGMQKTIELMSGASLINAGSGTVVASSLVAGGSSVAISSLAAPTITTGLSGLGVGAATAAIPVVNVIALAAMPLVSHIAASCQIDDIECEKYRLERKVSELDENITKIKNARNQIDQNYKALNKALDAFSSEYNKALSVVYPEGVDDATVCKNWKLYTEEERTVVLNLINTVYSMLKIQNSK